MAVTTDARTETPTEPSAVRLRGVWDALRSREGMLLVFGLFCLTLLWKFGRTHHFRRVFGESFAGHEFETLLPYLWVSGSSVVTRMLLPLAFIVLVLREKPRDFGYQLNGTGGLGRIYLVLLAIMVPLLWLAAGTPAFQHKYPFWSEAGASWSNLLLWEARYFFIFLSGESFWRGFLLFGLAKRFGWHALSISMIPYVMVHFGKPPIETLGAIVTAYVLGYLALKHRSFWLGVLLHFTIAFLMDVFSLIRQGALPTVW